MRSKAKVGLTIDAELLRNVEEARGMVKRATFIEYLVQLGLEAHLKKEKELHG